MLDELLNDKKVPEQITLNELDKPEGRNIWVDLKESTGEAEVHLADLYETELANDLKLLEEVKERVAAKNAEIKAFLEANALGSFKTDKLNIKYVSATTQTSIDTTLLKKELPDIAAKYSKTVPKSSSVSIKVVE